METKIISTLKKVEELFTSENFKIDYIIDNEIYELKAVSNYLNVNQIEALLFCAIFSINLEQHNSFIKDIGKKLNLDYYEAIEYIDVIKSLIQKKLVKIKKSGFRSENSINNSNYYISKQIVNAIIKNKPCPIEKASPIETDLEVVKYFAEYIDLIHQEEIELDEVKNLFPILIEEFEKYKIIQFCTSHKLTFVDTFLVLYVINQYSEGKQGVELDVFNACIFNESRQKIRYIQSLISENNYLTKNNFLELSTNGFAQDYECYLTKSFINHLKTIGIHFNNTKNDYWNLRKPEDIIEKELILNPDENKQVKVLHSILEQNKFNELLNKMKNKGYQMGINILFYGQPGTGKTESAYQIAKKCNRKILTVDISNLKSMWYGQSEKIIKRVFKDYASFSETEENLPILFFNEADAVFSKRNNSLSSSTDQTENTIQNILLNELENFNGILIATTNMEGNFDKAFERRFLYKINYSLPEQPALEKLWKLKFPKLKRHELDYLTSNFKLSGGQIDNIHRKAEIEMLLFNKKHLFEDLIAYCTQENLQKTNLPQIGFFANKAS